MYHFPSCLWFCSQISGMAQLWEIALRALNSDVSVAAIQYVNSYYIGFGSGLLEKEEEFVQRCMGSLVQELANVQQVGVGVSWFSTQRTRCHC